MITLVSNLATLLPGIKQAGGAGHFAALFLAIFATIIVGVPIVRALWLYYSFAEQRYFWDQTSFGKSRFRFTAEFGPFLKLKLVNLFLLLFTLGFAWPWVTIRNIRFTLDNLTLHGTDTFDDVLQDFQAAPPTGEGLDGFLDTGFDFG
jgi:uncharacterized membrane protein YjgN (DUF898 family)